jgi:F-type H+-transporting ATPase subunit b
MTTHLSASDSTASLISAAGGINLDFDLSFLGQMVAFSILLIVLKPLLFDPLLKLFEERERRTEGAKLLARRMDERAGELLRRYQTELAAARKAASEERERLRGEGLKIESQILSEARTEVGKVIDEGKARIAREAATLRAELSAKSGELARDIASRVLGREVG